MNAEDEFSSPENDVYVGPRPFRTGQKLYGRDRESRQLVSLVISQRLVLLHAPSGAGKTSLINAKVVPALQKRRFDIPTHEIAADAPPQPVVIRVNRSPEEDDPPGVNRYALSVLLSLELHRAPEDRRPAAELAALTIDQYLEASFPNASLEPGEETESGGTFRPLLLLFDQFEELLTLDPTDAEAKRDFLRQLGAALENEGRWVLFSIREDFLGALEPFLPAIPTGLAATYHLDHLKAEIAAEAIKEPAHEAGVTFEDGVVENLVEDLRQVRVQGSDGGFEMKAGPYVEPVHLQVVCQSLWQVKGDAREIRHEHLEKLSRGKGTGVDEVLASYYAGRVRHAAETGEVGERRVRDWFGKQLIGVQKVRRPILVNEAIEFGMTTECLDVLDKAFLIRRETRSGAHWYELAHDRLMDPIVTDNEAWRAENLSSFQVQAEIWGERGRPEYLLLKDEALAEAEREAAAGDDGSLTKTDREFLAESEQAQEKARAEQDRAHQAERIRKLRAYLGLGATALLVMAALTVWAFYQEKLADRAEQKAEWAAYSGLIGQAQDAWNQGYLRLARVYLRRCLEVKDSEEGVEFTEKTKSREQTNYRDHLDWEFRYLQSLFARDQRTFFGHEANVTSVVFHPGGQSVASGSIDGTVRIWNVASRAEIKSPPYDAKNWIRCITYNHDGSRLACGTDEKVVIVWDTETGEEIQRLQGHEDSVTAVAFGPGDLDTLIASGSVDGTIRFWDAARHEEMEESVSATHARGVTCIEFEPSGKWVASGSADGEVHFWNAPEKTKIASIRNLTPDGSVSEVNAIAVSPQGGWIAVGGEDGRIRFWKTGDLESDPDPLRKPGHILAPPPGAETPAFITALEFSPDGTHLSAGYRDGRIRECRWNESEPRPEWETGASNVISEQAHLGAVSSLAYPPSQPSANSRMIVSGGVDCLLRTSGTGPKNGPRQIRESDIIWHAEFSPDGDRIASGNADGHISVYDVSDSDLPPKNLEPPGDESLAEVWWVDFSPDGSLLATGGKDRKVRIWDVGDHSLLKAFKGHTQSITCVAFSHDGKRMASSDEASEILIWDADGAETQEPQRLLGHEGWVTNVAFGNDDRILVSSGEDETLGVWNLETTPPKLIRKLRKHEDVIQTVEFSKDGKRFASGSADKTIIVWDTRTLEPVLPPLRGHAAWVTGLAFHPDGKRLASGSQDNTIKLWELETGQEVLTLKGHKDTVWSVDFSRDGNRLLSASEDRTMKIWRALDAGTETLTGRMEERKNR